MTTLDTASATNGRQRGSQGASGGRGRPAVVTMRRTTYAAVVLEGVALADEAIRAAARIQTAAAVGSRQLVVNEAGRLGHRATAARAEFMRLAAGVDDE